MSIQLYGAAAYTYRNAGWAGVLPLPAQRKDPPPTGFTGVGRVDPTAAQIDDWIAGKPYRGTIDGITQWISPDNIALRLPDGIIGYDADLYKAEGRKTHADLVARCGGLPPTWTSTSRDDGSGIRFYRIPESVKLRGALGGVEIIQHHHRYAVVAPSIHPDSGLPYRWISPDGDVVLEVVPGPDTFPDLPALWVAALQEPEPAERAARDRVTGEWARCVKDTLTDAVASFSGGSRHDTALASALALVRFADLGYPGADDGLESLGETFRARVLDRPCSEAEAEAEWRRIVDGAWKKVRSSPSTIPCWEDSTEHARRESKEWMDEVERQLNEQQPAAASEPKLTLTWDDPVPLDSYEVPPFPTYALPEWLGDYVSALAVATQTPPDLAGMLVLAMLSAASGGWVALDVRPGWSETTNLYSVVALASGENKSGPYRMIRYPLHVLERQLLEGAMPGIIKARALKEVAEARAAGSKALAGKAKALDRQKAEAEAVLDAQAAADLEVPAPPRIFVEDVTPERLATLLAEQEGRLALFSPEGGVFGMMAGRYEQRGAGPNLDVYLKAHDGEPIYVDRVKSQSAIVDYPCLTVGLTVQPDVLRGLAAVPGFKGRGLLGRFLYALPTGWMGSRDLNPAPVPPAVADTYHSRLLSLASFLRTTTDPPVRLQFSGAAVKRIVEFRGTIEPRLSPTGDLRHMSEWAGKLHGAVARLAGLFHIAEHHRPETGWSGPVDAQAAGRAVELGSYLLAHARAAHDLMGADDMLERARYLFDWLRSRPPVETISCREVMIATTRSRFPTAADTNETLQNLADLGWLRPLERAEGGGIGSSRKVGRPPSAKWSVNPALYTTKCTEYTKLQTTPTSLQAANTSDPPATNFVESVDFVLRGAGSDDVDLTRAAQTDETAGLTTSDATESHQCAGCGKTLLSATATYCWDCQLAEP